MALNTRRPTGNPPWPILLIAGVPKAGKSYAAAEASASPLIGRTLWVGIGEDDPDELGGIPGARFEIVTHDGTYLGILSTLEACVEELRGGDLPGLIVVDSMTRLWGLLTDEAQHLANQRAAKKARKMNWSAPTEDVTISMDLWNRAKARWESVMDVLRSHQGPVIVTARLDQTAVMNAKGEPTPEKVWKVQAHKSLPWEVGAIVEFPEPRRAYLSGVRSLRVPIPVGEPRAVPDFNVDRLWREMGLDGGAAHRRHADIDAGDSVDADTRADADLDAAKRDTWAAWQNTGRGDVDAFITEFETRYGHPPEDATVAELRAFTTTLTSQETNQ